MSGNEELPFVSVIIPAYNEEKRIANAIEAVLRQTYPKDKMELIVVDDGSTDKTCEVVSKYPVKLIRHNKNRGDSASRNTGAKNAIGEILATTDADDRVDKNWLINIAKHYSEAKVGSVVGSSHIICNDKNWLQRIAAELFICLREGIAVKNIYNSRGGVGSGKSIGSNQSFREKVFNEIRGYDMGLSAGMEQDIVWRVEKAGYSVLFEPKAIVYINQRDEFKRYVKQKYVNAKGAAHVYFKHFSKITFNHILTILYLPITIILLLGFLLNIKPLSYLLILALAAPVGYHITKLITGRHYIKKSSDVIFILILGYIGFIITSIGVLKGCYDYIFNYKEKLMD